MGEPADAQDRTPPQTAELCICCDAETLERHPFHPELDVFRPPERQHEALVGLVRSGEGCVSAAFAEGVTVGYVALQKPERFERWSCDPTCRIWELGAVEVAPGWRGRGLAQKLLERTFATGFFDDKVVIAQLLSWHYDTERTGVSPFTYREALIRLYRKVGFRVWRTDDPEIAGHIENALMARIGPGAPPETVEQFHRLRLKGTAPWDFPF